MIFFSKNLKHLRKIKKLSQEELATNLGLNRGNIASYEKGTAEPKLENLLKFVNFFNISPIDLIGKDLEIQQDMASQKGSLEMSFHLREQAQTYQRIIDGFKAYHHYKTAQDEVNYESLLSDYTRMLEVSESILNHYLMLIDLLEEPQ
jgi:transcriptional regulator with XRE-family HTH domain